MLNLQDRQSVIKKKLFNGNCSVFLRRAIDTLSANGIDFNHLYDLSANGLESEEI